MLGVGATRPTSLPHVEVEGLAVDRGGFELWGWRSKAETAGRAVLCLHETATSSEVWRTFAEALAPRASVVAYDRRGWGRSGAPDDYRRTTIEEQAADAEAVIASLDAGPVALCGAGIGAVIALELAVHRPELVAVAILIEPPLLALVPEATPVISADVEAIRRATLAASARRAESSDPRDAAAHGARAAAELYLAGGLEALGAGAQRIPDELAADATSGPFALFAEPPAVSEWTIPLVELPGVSVPVAVVVSGSTPPFVRRAGEALAVRLPDSPRRELEARGLPQLDGAGELAELAVELA
jgi:pimeloyl-ACP methyl ester carboxylesterase